MDRVALIEQVEQVIYRGLAAFSRLPSAEDLRTEITLTWKLKGRRVRRLAARAGTRGRRGARAIRCARLFEARLGDGPCVDCGRTGELHVSLGLFERVAAEVMATTAPLVSRAAPTFHSPGRGAIT